MLRRILAFLRHPFTKENTVSVTVSLTVLPSAPNHGDTVTATYAVVGNDGTPAGPPVQGSLVGDVTVGSDVLHAVTTLTLPGTPAVPPLPETFSVPVFSGLTFAATSAPNVFTALVP